MARISLEVESARAARAAAEYKRSRQVWVNFAAVGVEAAKNVEARIGTPMAHIPWAQEEFIAEKRELIRRVLAGDLTDLAY